MVWPCIENHPTEFLTFNFNFFDGKVVQLLFEGDFDDPDDRSRKAQEFRSVIDGTNKST